MNLKHAITDIKSWFATPTRIPVGKYSWPNIPKKSTLFGRGKETRKRKKTGENDTTGASSAMRLVYKRHVHGSCINSPRPPPFF
jgi:hypothetical protein